MKELIRVRVQYASRQQCCKTHKQPLPYLFTHRRLVMDVSGLHIGPIVKGQDVEDFLSLEYGTDMLSRNVHNQPTMRNNPEERRSQHYTGSKA